MIHNKLRPRNLISTAKDVRVWVMCGTDKENILYYYNIMHSERTRMINFIEAKPIGTNLKKQKYL